MQVKFFTAPVQTLPGDTDHNKPVRQAEYWRALGTVRQIEIIPGHFAVNKLYRYLVVPLPDGTEKVQVYTPEEKGSDVNLATHLIHDAYRNLYDTALVISNDADLREPLRIARDELKKIIAVVNPRSAGVAAEKAVKSSFENVASLFLRLSKTKLENSQFPDTLYDPQGNIIQRPVEWTASYIYSCSRESASPVEASV